MPTVKFLAKLSLLGLALACIAAPGFGGGGGGGVGGGYGGGGFGGYGGDYYGSHDFSGGYRGSSDPWAIVTLFGIVGLVSGVSLVRGKLIKNRLVEVAVVTRDGVATGKALDEYLSRADYITAIGRSQAIAAVAKIVESVIVDGWIRQVSDETRFPTSDAEEAFSRRMGQLGLAKLSGAQVLADSSLRTSESGHEACLVGMIFTLKGRPVAAGRLPEVKAMLGRVRGFSSYRNMLVAYVYYAPDPGKSLTLEEAEGQLRTLQSTPYIASEAHIDGHCSMSS